MWDKRARVGEAMWARRKLHREAKLLGRRRVLGTAWDTWRAEVLRAHILRTFLSQKGGLGSGVLIGRGNDILPSLYYPNSCRHEVLYKKLLLHKNGMI